MNASRILMVLLILVLPRGQAWADETAVLWQLEGSSNSVYLLGSVHLLRQSDYPLPPLMSDAYERSAKVVMELDLDDMDPVADQQLALSLALAPAGEDLASLIGPDAYREASEGLREAGMDLDLMKPFKPWFAAISVMSMRMIALGFNPKLGVEQHFVDRARQDGKEVLGLETTEFQLRLFDAMPLDVQRQLLLQTATELTEMDSQIDEMIEAWKAGNTGLLATMLVDHMAEYPDLYVALVSDRNRNWVSVVAELAREDEDVLVVVGALHLVGRDSLVSLLRERGFKVRAVAPGGSLTEPKTRRPAIAAAP